MNKILLCLLFNLSFFMTQPSFAQKSAIAKVVRIKGAVLVQDLPLKLNDSLNEGDTVTTKAGSFVRLQFNDNSFVNVGSESELFIKSYRQLEGKRRNNLKVLRGKVRVLVNKFADPGEEIVVGAKQITLGVRGTEFLVNSYSFGGAPSTDVLLVKGSLKASGAGFTAFTMEPGQFFNSQDLLRNGMKALKTLGKDALLKLKGASDSFIPDLQTSNGLLDLGGSLLAPVATIGLGAAGLLAGGDNEWSKNPEEPKEKTLLTDKEDDKKRTAKKDHKEKSTIGPAKSKTTVKGQLDFQYDLTKEKWDIRDAVINRPKNKSENKCFYFFYKKLPGAGEPERFRRERDCDEFEYNL